MPIRIHTYHRGDALPDLPGNRIFHSTELFHVYEKTRGYDPLLLVAYDDGHPVAKLLAVVRKSVRWFPPAFIHRCEIYGNGEFFIPPPADHPHQVLNREILFAEMLEYLTQECLPKAFLIEFRNLDNPLFGYKAFRTNHYFAINWLRVHNSLHSRPPQERLSLSRKRQIQKALQNGATLEIAHDEKDIEAFAYMLKKTYSAQVRKHFPDIDFFRLLTQMNPSKELAKVFLVKYKQKIIGGSICLFSSDTVYLLFSGGLRKSYARLYPGILAVWGALTYAHEHGYDHLEFMDAGLPFKKFGYRDFILRFGGKQSSTRRWFRFRWDWLNCLLCKIYQ